MPKKINYEQFIEKLEEIVNKLENPDTSLEDSINLYKEGIDIAKFCNEKLDSMEGEIKILKKSVDDIFTKEDWVEN
ncbi:MAG: exodeoxyribonuclease VII small subunit [Defluviitaleaceae bacterium]|nr:exodeoxyribonuclease VII small subunit [Defluviitaleaceae bacterium]